MQILEDITEEDGIMNLGTIIWGENVKNNGKTD